MYSLGQPSAISADPVPGASTMKAGQVSLSTTLVQTLSSISCNRTAWDLGRSSSRAVSKARHGIPEYGVPPSKPVHVLRSAASAHLDLPRPRPVPSKRGAYATYPSLQCGTPESGLVVKAPAFSRSPGASEALHGTLQSSLPVPSTAGSAQLTSILQKSTSKAPTVCTSAQVHAKNWAKALRLWKDLCVTLMAASSCLPDIFSSPNCDKLLEKLLCKVSDTAALRYISSAVKVVSALQDLDLPLDAPSQVQLIDSWLAAQKEAGKDTSLHSENALKALRWLKQTAALHHWPDLYQALFATGAWKQVALGRNRFHCLWLSWRGGRPVFFWMPLMFALLCLRARCSCAFGDHFVFQMCNMFFGLTPCLTTLHSELLLTGRRRPGLCRLAFTVEAFTSGLLPRVGFCIGYRLLSPYHMSICSLHHLLILGSCVWRVVLSLPCHIVLHWLLCDLFSPVGVAFLRSRCCCTHCIP